MDSEDKQELSSAVSTQLISMRFSHLISVEFLFQIDSTFEEIQFNCLAKKPRQNYRW